VIAEGEAPRAQPHDVEPRRAVGQHELRVGRPEGRAVLGGHDHLAEGREALSIDLYWMQHDFGSHGISPSQFLSFLFCC